MPNDPEKRNSFIVERLPSFIIRDCGTGAGGFKSGNACAKGGGESGGGEGDSAGGDDDEDKFDADGNWIKPPTNYDKLAEELSLPASFLKEGIMDVEGIQEAKIKIDEDLITDDAEMSEIDLEISDGEVGNVDYLYKVEGAEGENFKLDVNIRIEKNYDEDTDEYETDDDGNVVATGAISFELDDSYEAGTNPNHKGQGPKILSLVEHSITHFMKSCPNQTDFNFTGAGQGRNGLARQLLYRRLAQRIAKKTGGKFKEKTTKTKNPNGKDFIFHSSTFFISNNPKRLPRSIREINKDALYIFTFTFETALGDSIDKDEQEFWDLGAVNDASNSDDKQ